MSDPSPEHSPVAGGASPHSGAQSPVPAGVSDSDTLRSGGLSPDTLDLNQGASAQSWDETLQTPSKKAPAATDTSLLPATVDARFTDMIDLSELQEDDDTQTIAEDTSGAVTITTKLQTKSPPSSEVLGNLRSVIRDRYRERGQLGRGGMATVYDSVDLGLRRHVAVKVLRPEHLRRESGDTNERSTLQRFVEEAQITAQLEHPNIVPIHEIGVDRYERVYFTMKRVEGDSLRSVFDNMRDGDEEFLRQYPVTGLCELFLKICDAIRFAHSRNVIHRDLKPDNIMVGRFGEVQVMDWGLAKVLSADEPPSARETFTGMVSTDAGKESEARHTLEGTISGTPAYMSPEQARGDTAAVGMHSDIFLLGALLYEMITLVPPFHADSSMAALRRAQHYDLAPPAQAVDTLRRTGALPDGTKVHERAQFRVKSFPKELAAIALKAMARDPAKRYPRVLELMDDVRRFLTNRQVSVAKDNPVRTFIKWSSRNPSLVTGLGLTIIMFLIAGSLIIFFSGTLKRQDEEHSREARERDRMERQREEEEQKRQARRQRAEDEMQSAVDLLLRASTALDQDIITEYRSKALGNLNQAIYTDPTFVAPWFMRGYVNLDLGRLLDARNDFLQGNDILRREDPILGPTKQDPGTLMAAAMIAFTQHEMMHRDDAVEVYLSCIQRVKECTEASSDYFRLANILQRDYNAMQLQRSNPSDFAVLREAAKMRAETDREIHVMLSKGTQRLWEAHLWAGWFDATSIPNWDNPYTFDPQLIDSRRWNSRVFEAADVELSAAIDRRRQLPLAIFLKTRLHIAEKIARQGARTLSEVEPDFYWKSYRNDFRNDPMGHYGYAMQILSLGNSSTGLRYDEDFGLATLVQGALEKAIRLYPRFTEAYEALALNHEMNGDVAGAIAKYVDIMERWEKGLIHRPSLFSLRRFTTALLRSKDIEQSLAHYQHLADRLARLAPDLISPLAEHVEAELPIYWNGRDATQCLSILLETSDPLTRTHRLATLALTCLEPEEAFRYMETYRSMLPPGSRLDDLTIRQTEVHALRGGTLKPVTPEDLLMLSRINNISRPTPEHEKVLADAAIQSWALANASELRLALEEISARHTDADEREERLQLARLATRILDRLYELSPRDAQELVHDKSMARVVKEWLDQPVGS